MYKDLPRLFCPHRLGRNRAGQLRVLCYQYGGESESGLEPMGSPAELALRRTREAQASGTVGWFLETAPNHSRPATCVVEADIDAEDQPDRDPQKGQ